jgi:hypothetical protein
MSVAQGSVLSKKEGIMAIQDPVPVLISIYIDTTTGTPMFSLDDPSPDVDVTGQREVTFFRSTGEPSALFNVTFDLVTEGYQFGSPAIQFTGLPVGIPPSSPTTVVLANTNDVPAGDPPQVTKFTFRIGKVGEKIFQTDDPTIINNPDPPSGS